MSAGLGVVVIESPVLLCLAFALLWVSGVLFGMGLEKRLLECKNRNIHTDDADDCAPHPLPVTQVEAGDRTDGASKGRLNIEPSADKHDGAVGVVLKRRHIGSAIPVGDFVANGGEDAQSITPNAELRGRPLADGPA